ncbi:hypothetical protein DERP_005743 [Dermatophagoides pteronyssinus]|uniref:Uncharacterized protein n=1 Tax=Dermatophagoides pteronyssinus TaxID=6956 RepID=A0ABQ8J9G0_DERPT|nr:hypothetical protein DERP_005743 [Dermatophagoides pteronyssinus]
MNKTKSDFFGHAMRIQYSGTDDNSGNVNVMTAVEARFNVTKRSPQIQLSSKCGSIDDPRSGLFRN